MSQKILDYRPVQRASEHWGHLGVLRAARVVLFAVTAINSVLVSWAALLPGWGSVFVLIAAAPINALVLFVSIVLIPSVRHATGGASVKPYVLTGVFAPIAGFLAACACVAALHRYAVHLDM